MKKYFLIFYFVYVLCNFSFSETAPIKVNVEELKINKNYNQAFYGGRLEPKNLIVQYSPSAGFISEIYVNEGDFVEKDAPLLSITKKASGGVTYNPTIVKSLSQGLVTKLGLTTGQEIFEKNEIATIADISNFKVSLLVSDKDITSIKTGDTCFVQNDQSLAGKITKISLMPETKTGLFKVETSFTNNSKLFVGKFIIIELRINFTNGISIPFNNITNKYGKTYIFIIENNTAKMREIKIINTYGNKVVIDGVKPGEKYVTYSDSNLSDGIAVAVEAAASNTQRRQNNGQFFGR
jgi:multidrug efflux pump subunit AcrA (membrane-fusion protein)